MATAGPQQQRPTASNPGKNVVGTYFDGRIVQERPIAAPGADQFVKTRHGDCERMGVDFTSGHTKEGQPMLVLTRYAGEEIVIGDDVRLTVVAVIGNKVRIGITAPSVVQVCRGEILGESPSPMYPKSPRSIRSKLRVIRVVKRRYLTQPC